MKKRTLGQKGLEVSALATDAWDFHPPMAAPSREKPALASFERPSSAA